MMHLRKEILDPISSAPFERTPIKELFENAENQDVKELKYMQLRFF
jgi:hypothetical protein